LVFEMSVIPPETSIKEDLPLKDGKLSGKVTSNAAEAPCLQSFGVEVAATGDKALISLWAARGILLLVAIVSFIFAERFLQNSFMQNDIC